MSEPETTKGRTAKEIFFEAIEKATPQERAAYLDGACGKDPALRRQVEDLLAKHFQQDSFMKQPAAEASKTVVVPISEGPGTVIGRYKLLEKLGEGGFGAVYVAEQKEPVKRRVALKIIKLGMDTKQVIARFEAERQALALMDHPNIAKVFDAGATETGRPYFVMELVRGVPITTYCDENKLSTVERLQLFMVVCQAIQHAHQKGIIHRDIKPSNILVTLHDGVAVPKVIDFGIAKATHGELTDKTIYTQFQQFIGTPAYISPEQAEMSGLDMDTRSDIYSLGVVLYELLIGRTPFDGRELVMSGLDEMRRIIREQEPLRPSTRLGGYTAEELTATAKRRGAEPPKLLHSVRGDLDWIVMKCLEKDRARRYETASGVSADLKRFLNNEPVVARPPSAVYQFQKFVRRHERAVAAAGAVAVAVMLALGFTAFALLRERAALVRERQAQFRQAAAEKAKKGETVRADAVAQFMKHLLAGTAPELLRQGHQRPIRELLKAADELASTGLSNAPAAELQLRDLMAVLYMTDLTGHLDSPAAYKQMKRITELLPSVPPDQLGITLLLADVPEDKRPAPRDEYRIRAAMLSLWVGETNRGVADLQALRDEFRRRTPPADRSLALCLMGEGSFYLWKGDPAAAETKFTEALRLMPADTAPFYFYVTRIGLAMALADRGAADRAERVAREGLLPTDRITPDLADVHVGLLSTLTDALCRQKLFAQAETLLRDQKDKLSARKDCSPGALHAIERQIGEVFARSGNAREALPILMSVATNSMGLMYDCTAAATIAIGSGDLENYRRLCVIALTRFTAGAEGINALNIANILLALPQNEVVIQVAGELLDRVGQAADFPKDTEVGSRHWLEFRKGHLVEAAALWAKRSELATPDPSWATRRKGSDSFKAALIAFRSALPLAHLGRSDEARLAYAEGMKELGPAPSPEKPRDLGGVGGGYARWYLAEAHRREVEQVFKAKGIAIPEPGAPSK